PLRRMKKAHYLLDEYAFAALRAGASGFLLKDALAAELCAAIRTVYRGDEVLAPPTTRRLVDHMLADRDCKKNGSGAETVVADGLMRAGFVGVEGRSRLGRTSAVSGI
ncbi:MAG TPA: hypothetical protein VJT72_05520, partial [Pseudonocardiaceae bacterium]|nr:hypothetical protein [Pseudonocardiaceae bacterium]